MHWEQHYAWSATWRTNVQLLPWLLGPLQSVPSLAAWGLWSLPASNETSVTITKRLLFTPVCSLLHSSLVLCYKIWEAKTCSLGYSVRQKPGRLVQCVCFGVSQVCWQKLQPFTSGRSSTWGNMCNCAALTGQSPSELAECNCKVSEIRQAKSSCVHRLQAALPSSS